MEHQCSAYVLPSETCVAWLSITAEEELFFLLDLRDLMVRRANTLP